MGRLHQYLSPLTFLPFSSKIKHHTSKTSCRLLCNLYLYLNNLHMSWVFSKKPKIPSPIVDHCLNCHIALTDNHHYCHVCGQKSHGSKLTLWELIKDFTSSILNIDGSFYKSLRHIFVPARIPRDFIAGRRRLYFNPIRLFVFSFIIHLAALSTLIHYEDITVSQDHTRMLEQFDLLNNLDTLYTSGQLNLEPAQFDSLKNSLFAKALNLPDTSVLLSSINIFGEESIRKYGISTLDSYKLSSAEIIEKYKVNNFVHKIIITQTIKATRNLSGLVRFAIGNLLWCVFITIIGLGVVMKLLYIRGHFYYVEHLILLFHIHAIIFTLTSIGLLLNSIIGSTSNQGYFIGFGIGLLLFILNMKYYYRQGWFKTLLKFSLVGFSYLILLTITVFIVGSLSFILYS